MTPRHSSNAYGLGIDDDVFVRAEDPFTILARTIWSAGDGVPIARAYQAGAEAFVERLALRPGEEVLDVACGPGTCTIPAARTDARVTGVDIAPRMIAQARRAARQAGRFVLFDVGDAERLPYADGHFDTTLSFFGVMFAYRPELAARELVRVTRPGGRVVLGTWLRESFLGQLLRAHAVLVPPPVGTGSPLQWGDVERVRELLGEGVTDVRAERRELTLSLPCSPGAVTELLATCYGPTIAALRATGPVGERQLRAEITRLFDEQNTATDGGTRVAVEYLEVAAVAR
jgi:SAM-dependent methyltransferase